MIRIQFAVTEKKSGRATKWDERKVGDYSAAMGALMAVAMGDDEFRREVVALAEARLPGIGTLVDPEDVAEGPMPELELVTFQRAVPVEGGWRWEETGHDVRVDYEAALRSEGRLLALAEGDAKPVVALDCPSMTEAEFIADPDNAILVTCRWDKELSDEANVFGILARAQHGPDTMAIEAVGFADWLGDERWREFQIRVWDRMKWLRAEGGDDGSRV